MNRDHQKITAWLGTGLVMVFIQILLGAITRLTGSGLSITKWDIVTGTLPPLNHLQWIHAFDLYRATPQYHQINEGMDLSRFKFIFFWEYFHRLWARTMGFVFLIPFIFFLVRKSLSRETIIRLLVVIGFAMLAAIFGWIMVASGLINRPWVNAYKLTIHLSLGISLLIALFYAWIKEKGYTIIRADIRQVRFISMLFYLVVLQIILGGMMSGMKAALIYPTWPKMHKEWVPQVLKVGEHWNLNNFLIYDHSGFMPALVQVLHRFMGYFLFVLILIFYWKFRQNISRYGVVLLGIIVAQIGLGILTIISSIGSIPVLYGTLHQAVGIIIITFLFYLRLRIKSHILS